MLEGGKFNPRESFDHDDYDLGEIFIADFSNTLRLKLVA